MGGEKKVPSTRVAPITEEESQKKKKKGIANHLLKK